MSQLPKNFTSESLPIKIRFGQRRCTVRRLRQQDSGRLLEFFQTHTPETVRLRYGYPGYVMTPEQAEQLAGVDQKRDAALGVFEQEGKKVRIVAVGRYTLDPDGVSAEMAFVTHEDRRALGMASFLCEALICIARERKIRRFRAQTSIDNYPMLGIFIKNGASVREIPGTEATEVSMPLDPEQQSD